MVRWLEAEHVKVANGVVLALPTLLHEEAMMKMRLCGRCL
jgi:hypothetical protein